jgi:hypothetical protein
MPSSYQQPTIEQVGSSQTSFLGFFAAFAAILWAALVWDVAIVVHTALVAGWAVAVVAIVPVKVAVATGPDQPAQPVPGPEQPVGTIQLLPG